VVRTGLRIFLISFSVKGAAGEERAPHRHRLSLEQAICVGSAAGATEVASTGQVLRYVSNMKALRLPCSTHPLHWYKGTLVTMSSMVPITAIQKVGRVYGENLLRQRYHREPSDGQKLFIASFSGASSALVATPCEAVPLYLQVQQHHKKTSLTPWQALKELKGAAWRGISLVAPRNAFYVAFYGSVAGLMKQKAEMQCGPSPATTVFSGVATGVGAAVVTQPLAVLKILLQADPHKERYPTISDAASSLYRKEGARGFFRGLLLGRGPRVACAVPILAESERVYTELITAYSPTSS